ncbi:MAG TPA: cytochrome c maturation protein CcmE [Sphingomicrobium sp.]|nr:cytochrome c maturation protein CcmE [Sphingomicrobium sp.]
MVKPKHQRLVLIAVAVAAILAAVLLAMWGLRDRAAYFYTPAEIAAGEAVVGKPIRLGGMVAEGSTERLADGVTIRFRIADGEAAVPVVYRGIVPDLFREGSGAVAEGRLAADGTFVAHNILAKHDERYMPPELGNPAAEHKAAKTVEK